MTQSARARTDASRHDTLALVCCVGAGFATLLDSSVVTYAVPSLADSLAAPTSGIQWFLAAYSLTFGVGLVPGGRLGDAYGRRPLFLVGLVLFLAGALFSGFAPTIWVAVGARAAQGIGAGLVSAQVLGIIQDRFAGARRVRALAAYTVAGAAAAVVGPLATGALLGILPADVAWRAILLLNVPFIAATLVLAIRFIPAVARQPRRVDLDLPGVAGVAALVLIVTMPVIDPGMGSTGIATIVVASVALIVALVFWERRYSRRGRVPLFVPALMRSRGFIRGNVIALTWFGSALGQGTVLTIFLLQGVGLSALGAALVLIPGAAARVVASSFSSRVFARVGPVLITVALAVQVAAVITLVSVSDTVEGGALLAAFTTFEVVVGIASGLLEPPLRAVTLGFSAAPFHGVAASFLQLSQRLSATFCVALVTGLVLSGGGGAHAASVEGLRLGLLACAVLLGIAFAASCARWKLPIS
ncbi:MFS transporter [Glaciihabitans sp. dw_435]|uniref:MFS transporter n=1 Tax=Glaciihabitans sp. dw_435 TaxID=2720081 RepID=UPI001BD64630|nr:MFS transporter [Glaciihabitans sp. dw_435]